MNNKDRDHIGCLLSSCHNIEQFKELIFQYDDKIEREYKSYEYVNGRDSDVDNLFTEILVEKFGEDWAITRACTREHTKAAMISARKQIYGADYRLIFKDD